MKNDTDSEKVDNLSESSGLQTLARIIARAHLARLQRVLDERPKDETGKIKGENDENVLGD
ncbi:MAG: hypothetical protein PHI12_10315 [Dehalococcoidales bacterium]|nr:hypothetical protein [Dehalococcoidales bacterium]